MLDFEGDAAMVAEKPHWRRLSSFDHFSSSSWRQAPSRPTASSELPKGAGSDGASVGHAQTGVGFSLDIYWSEAENVRSGQVAGGAYRNQQSQ
jgi:hypothetical protein